MLLYERALAINMERFFSYIAQYVRLNAAEKDFLRSHAGFRRFQKNDYYLFRGESKARWCFLLSGIAAGCYTDHAGKDYIHWISVQYDYFTGTKHTFSDNTAELDIQFLQPSVLLEIPLVHVRVAHEKYPKLAEFFQILLRKQLLFTQNMLRIQKINDGTHRYLEFRRRLPELERQLTMHETCSLLNIWPRTYKKGQQLFFQSPD